MGDFQVVTTSAATERAQLASERSLATDSDVVSHDGEAQEEQIPFMQRRAGCYFFASAMSSLASSQIS